MKTNVKQSLSVWIITLFLLLSGALVQAQPSGELTVFAAASLTDAYEAIAESFEAEFPDVEVLFNFGGSSTLATQLVQGAPADIFASANNAQMQVAIDGERIAGSARTFAKNRLVLIVPADNRANIQSLRDLANPDLRLILAAPEVPIRAYTDTMLERMANDESYGEDYRSAVLENLVSEEPNVRQVSAKVALGEADAGIVYRSDVTPDIAESVIMLAIPDAFNTIATYPIAITDDSDQPELAQTFIDFVLSDTGQDILVAWNFISVRIPELPDTVTIPTDGTLLVDGQVLNPLSLTANSLQKDFAPQTLEIPSNDGDETVTIPFTGALLWDVISAAQPNLNADVPGDHLSMYLVATSANGWQGVVAWGEIDPIHGNQTIIVAYEANGWPISNDKLHLVFSPEAGVRRLLFDVVNISLRDAPATGD
ncbi:MAG: molybdate ABC transporter substrate-binding protein [Aggregatilineales bacterium]